MPRLMIILAMAMAVLGCGKTPENQQKKKSQPIEYAVELDEILNAFNRASSEYFSQLVAAKTDEERNQLKQPNAEAVANRILELFDGRENEPAYPKAVEWIISNTESQPRHIDAVDKLIQHHPNSPILGGICLTLGYSNLHNTLMIVQKVATVSKDRANVAAANLVHARLLDESTDRQRIVQLLESVMANEELEVAGIDVVAAAKTHLFQITTLGIGQTAPEITGEDHEKVAFRLSDYRGKVVLLDFWANW